MRMKLVVKALVLVAACLMVSGAWTTEAQQEPLKVGFIQPLSGPIAAPLDIKTAANPPTINAKGG